jgi:hypothetical protein
MATLAARRLALSLALVLALWSNVAWAQRPQVTTQVPLKSVNDSFFERVGVGASFRIPGVSLNLGGFGSAIPQFGGFQPGAGLTGGFGINGGKFGANVAFEASQGSRRSNVMQAGSLTMMDGQSAVLQDITQSPFVVSGGGQAPWKQNFERFIPYRPKEDTVPAAPRAADAAAPDQKIERQTAEGGDRALASVADIRRQKQAAEQARNEQAAQHFARAEQAEKEGKPGVAKVYYQLAAKHASGQLQERALERIKRLSGSK